MTVALLAERETRVRMDPRTRKSLILASARELFAESGYSGTGMAEIARRAQVSKTLLYHYWPEGRPEILVAVMDQILERVTALTGAALALPLEPSRRIDRLVVDFMGYFEDHPQDYRILFTEPWGTAEPRIVSRAVLAGKELTSMLIVTLAGTGADAEVLLATTGGIVGLLLSLTEAVLSGQVAAETAAETASAFIGGGLARLRP
jgi:AcrR family transcriptional regulator